MVQSKHLASGSGKRTNTDKKKKGLARYVGVFLLILFGFFIVNILLRLPGVLKVVNEPFGKIEGRFANAVRFEPKYRTSLLLLGTNHSGEVREAVVASFDPSGKQLNFVSIPLDIPIITKLGQPMNLKDLIEKDFDRAFFEVSLLAGTTLQGYLSFSDSPGIERENILQQKSKLLSLAYLLTIFEQKSWLDKHLKTNLSTGQIFSAAQAFKSVNLEAIHFTSLKEAVVRGLFDSDRLDDLSQKTFFDSEIGSERVSVSVVNGSEVAGLGSSLKRLIANLGGRVISVDSKKATKTLVTFAKGKDKLARAIARFLQVEARQEDSTRIEVNINIGSDFADKLGIE